MTFTVKKPQPTLRRIRSYYRLLTYSGDHMNKNRGVHMMRLPRRHLLCIFFRRMDGQTDGPTFLSFINCL